MKTIREGYVAVFIYCLFMALGFVFMGQFVEKFSPVLSTFLTYAFTAVIFLLLRIRSWSAWYGIVKSHRRLVGLINSQSLLIMIAAYTSLRYVSAVSYLIVFFGVSPGILCLVQKKIASIHDKLNIGILLPVAIICGIYSNNTITLQTLMGITLVCFCAWIAIYYMQSSNALQKESGISSAGIVALRFLLVSLVTGALSWSELCHLHFSMNMNLSLAIIVIAGGCIPFYTSQLAINRLGPVRTAKWFPVTPVLCVLWYLVLGTHIETSVLIASIVFAVVMFLVNTKIFSLYKKGAST